MDKIQAVVLSNVLNLSPLYHFVYMVKKFVFSVVVKSRRKMAFVQVNRYTNVILAVVNF